MFSYALKRVTRSSGLFIALLLGVTLASVFFAGINIGADSTARASLNQQLDGVLVDVVTHGWGLTLSSDNWTTAAELASSIQGVLDTEIITRGDSYREKVAEDSTYYRVVGIAEDSQIFEGMNVTSGSDSLGRNEAFIWVGSQDSSQFEINDTLTLNFTYPVFDFNYTEEVLSLKLKVAGFIALDDSAYAIASGLYQQDVFSVSPDLQEMPQYYGNLLIVSWEETFVELLDSVYTFAPLYSPFNTDLLVFLDRESMINLWDVDASQEAIDRTVGQINNALAKYDVRAYSNLHSALYRYGYLSVTLRLSYLVVALPVFFVAWYVGTTVSDVSFNLRRREIGLLLAKGFSSGQLFRLFLSESLMIGIIGGLIGVALGGLLSPSFVLPLEGGMTAPIQMVSIEIVVITVIFSTTLTLLSTFRPSRKAAKLPAIDALKEYILLEEIKPYKRKWPLLALILGSYKIIMFLIGVPSVAQLLVGRSLPFSNILIMILFVVWTAVDSILTPLGPVLFFWGVTKILIRGSLSFQVIIGRTIKFLGDMGTLATKNVQRNPARAASVAFLIALVVGYGFQTVLTLASEEDYVVRQAKATIGADINLILGSTPNSSAVIENLTRIAGVDSLSLQYSFHGETSLHSLQLVAVEPTEWLSTAYYEDEWFTGKSVENAFQQMNEGNNTIILEFGVAKDLDLRIGDAVAVTVDGAMMTLEIVGFFGHDVGSSIQPLVRDNYAQYLGSRFWSFVPADLYHSINGGPSVSEKILIQVEAGFDEKQVAIEIRSLNLTDVLQVQSVEEQLEQRERDLVLSGTSTIQRTGVVFAILAGSVATTLAMLVSLQERKKEIAIMNVRGFSLRQLVTMLLCEHVAVIVFAIVLGAAVGIVIASGSITALNSTISSLVIRHITIPPQSFLMLSLCVLIVLVFSILPIVIISKKFTSKLERIVRL